MNAVIQPQLTEKVDRLKIKVYANRNELGEAAGEAVAVKMKELLKMKQEIRMIFAAAPSQNEFLETLVSHSELDWTRVIAFHMDEYIGLPSGAPQRFSRFLTERIFSIVQPKEVHLIDCSSSIEKEKKRYSDLISLAPIDIICMGIGENGHIAFNDPPVADFADTEVIKAVQLDDACRSQQVNDGCFSTFEEVPSHALTLTVPTLLSGKYLFCMVPGSTKREALKRVRKGPISTVCPASILRNHDNCILFADNDSYSNEAYC